MIEKLKYILLIILLFTATNIFAQFNIGAYGGLNMAGFSGDHPEKGEYSSRAGAGFGVLFDLNITEHIVIGLQPGLLQRGTKVSYSVKGQEEPVDSVDIKINYFSVPLILKISAKNERLYAVGGIEAGVPLSANALFLNNPDKDKDVMKLLSDVNIVMHFGVGYRIPLGKPVLFIEARYLQGLNNAVPVTKPEYNFFPRVRTNDFQILCGIEFPLF